MNASRGGTLLLTAGFRASMMAAASDKEEAMRDSILVSSFRRSAWETGGWVSDELVSLCRDEGESAAGEAKGISMISPFTCS